ncbi:hypothetical protein SUGI_0016700 [Cryptomeria japonica]|nr:hypothetical protein SUGI_0016700 [Cryptomeria japonica]
MDNWVPKIVWPFKKMWHSIHKRFFAAHKKSRGIYILYEDVRSCGYEDVHVMWSILVDSSHTNHGNIPITQLPISPYAVSVNSESIPMS